MHIAYFTTARPIATSMAFLAVTLIGLVSLARLPVNLLPDVAFPRAIIWTSYRDVGPVEIEEFVTIPIENAVAAAPGVRKVSSVSREGVSLVTAEFAWGTDMDFAVLNLREKLDNVRHAFSPQVGRPVILRVDPLARPIMTLAVSGEASLHHLYALARDVFKRRLEQIDGVALATVTGGDQREIQIDVDMDKVTALGISLAEIERALQQANDSRTGGSIKKGRYRYALRTLGEFQSVEDIAATVIKLKPAPSTEGGNGLGVDVRLADIARITDGYRERQGMTRYNGRQAIGVLVTKESGANTVQVCDEILTVLGQMRAQYPEVALAVVDNQADFISGAIGQVNQALLLGGALAFLVLFFFLHDWRNPVNIAIAMPVSVIAAFALMYFSGVSLNMVSLGGLALGVGMLVDNSIVVLENIFRRQEEGLPLREASIEGTREVSMAIAASTFTTIAVFFPILYIEGVAGQLFRDQSLTVTFSLLASLVVAFTLLPMIAARWKISNQKREAPETPPFEGGPGGMSRTVDQSQTPEKHPSNPLQRGRSHREPATIDAKLKRRYSVVLTSLIARVTHFLKKIRHRIWSFLSGLVKFWLTGIGRFLQKITRPVFHAFDAVFEKILMRYEAFLTRALDKPRATLLAAAGAFVLALIAGLQIDRRLMPEVEQHRFTVSVNLPPGSTLEATAELASRIEKTALEMQGIAAVFSQIGIIEGDLRSLKSRIGEHIAGIEIFLEPDAATPRMMRVLQARMRAFAGDAVALQKPQTAIGEILGTSLADLTVQIRGNDEETAERLAEALRRKLAKIPGVTQVFSSEDEKHPEIRLIIDRERAATFEIPPRQIADFVERYMHGAVATDFKDFDRKIPILLRADPSQRMRLEQLLETPLQIDHRAVPLSQVLRIEEQMAPAVIEREGQARRRTLFAAISGRGYDAVAREVEQLIAATEIPDDFQVRPGGQREEMIGSFREMIFAFLLAFALVFMILAAQFESLTHPFTIIFAVPLALIGVVFGLLVTRQSFNIMSLIGVVVLVGIVVNDAIIKVDFINQEKRRGTPLREAILLAGRKRLRPILMTTITTVLGLTPMAIGFGDGAELRRPLAVAVIFGLSFATVLTLIVVPVIYQRMEVRGGSG